MKTGFPPGTSWGPLAIGILIAVVLSLFSFAPQFGPRVVATVSGGGGQGPGASNNANGNGTGNGPGPNGTGPSSGTIPGRSGVGGVGNGSNPGAGAYQCAAGKNGGSTAPGVTASEIDIATTKVTGGPGAGFLGEAVDGMNAAIDQFNSQHPEGICGRHVKLPGENAINDDWKGDVGKQYIDSFIHSGKVFALVGQPDSEGLDAAQAAQIIDNNQMPVVGTDGLLGRQYNDPWVWPVGAATVTNMHIIAKYWAGKGVKNFAIVYDKRYKFGTEGAKAFDQEVFRQTGSHIPGAGSDGCSAGPSAKFCGIDPNQSSFGSEITAFNGQCGPCDVVVMLLEPGPFGAWMQGEQSASTKWFNHLVGGEPLFDHNVAVSCGSACNKMSVWTGYRPAIAGSPFDTGKVSDFCSALKKERQSDDCENAFTEGAYLGTQLFIAAAQQAGPNLTRQSLKAALDAMTYDSGLASPLSYGTSLPHQANLSMAQFADNFNGNFNGWNFIHDGPEYWSDPSPHQDLR